MNYLNTHYILIPTHFFLQFQSQIHLQKKQEKELFINGETRDRGFIKPILKLHFDSIFKELQLNFDISQGYVLLTGGGSNIFKKAFSNRLNNLIISSDSIFDNVKGFKKIGEKLWR